MFAEEEPQKILETAKKISDLKNLGPTSEINFKKAGIKSVDAFVKMGWKKAFRMLVLSNPKHRNAIYAYALIGALQNKNLFYISAEDKVAAKALSALLKPPTGNRRAKKTKARP